MKETFYFSHDYNARNDEKIKRMMRKHGVEGYGLYWAIIEDLYQNGNELKFDCKGIAYDYRIDEKIVSSVLMEFELFETDICFFSSNSVGERLQQRNKKSAQARENAAKRWGKKNADEMQTQSKSNAIKESKGKESKGKEKESKHKYGEYKNVLITNIQKEKLIKDYGEETFDLYIKKLDEGIQQYGYKYKDHNLVMRNWIGKPKEGERNEKKDFNEGL